MDSINPSDVYNNKNKSSNSFFTDDKFIPVHQKEKILQIVSTDSSRTELSNFCTSDAETREVLLYGKVLKLEEMLNSMQNSIKELEKKCKLDSNKLKPFINRFLDFYFWDPTKYNIILSEDLLSENCFNLMIKKKILDSSYLTNNMLDLKKLFKLQYSYKIPEYKKKIKTSNDILFAPLETYTKFLFGALYDKLVAESDVNYLPLMKLRAALTRRFRFSLPDKIYSIDSVTRSNCKLTEIQTDRNITQSYFEFLKNNFQDIDDTNTNSELNFDLVYSKNKIIIDQDGLLVAKLGPSILKRSFPPHTDVPIDGELIDNDLSQESDETIKRPLKKFQNKRRKGEQ